MSLSIFQFNIIHRIEQIVSLSLLYLYVDIQVQKTGRYILWTILVLSLSILQFDIIHSLLQFLDWQTFLSALLALIAISAYHWILWFHSAEAVSQNCTSAAVQCLPQILTQWHRCRMLLWRFAHLHIWKRTAEKSHLLPDAQGGGDAVLQLLS